jgi:PAS domain S-box-containing protein
MRRDGSQFWARVSITSLKDSLGQLTGYSKVTRDITSHKLAQDQLITYRNHLEDLVEARTAALLAAQHDLAQFKMTLDQTLDCVFMFDPESLHCMYVNRGGIEQSGYDQAELSQLTPADLTPDYDATRLRKAVLQPLLDGKESVSRFETFLRSKQGHDLPVEVSIQLVTLDNTAQRIVAIVRDITERKKNEALMRERTLQLEATNTELEAFSYSVSHDLRAPLRAIDGFSQLLLEDYGDQLNNDGMEYLDRVRSAAQYMGQLIDDMLELARVTRAPMHTHDINLTAMAKEIMYRLREAEPARTVQTDIADGLRCMGDPRLLRVALENLLGNAWKYTGKTAAAHISFDTEQQGEQIVFRIRDNGAGFDMKFAGRMFSAFQRMHRKEEFEGTGIGLATVSRIVQRHGGRVWAQAKPGQGATFYFTLS